MPSIPYPSTIIQRSVLIRSTEFTLGSDLVTVNLRGVASHLEPLFIDTACTDAKPYGMHEIVRDLPSSLWTFNAG